MKLNDRLNLEADKDTTRYFQYFTMKEIVDVSFILDFIENNLSSIIHHRNMLPNFDQYTLVTLSTVEISIDFSENLTLSLPVKI